ncbi:PIG-L family deacetylase [Pelagibacterium limicola]|uniref:PIG-L family deacetylase n=1 Tax=Pelagibacterium limicola TaxID=2791022 RepID=UPI0018AFD0DB|nr:PIG-L family deacetylase [Pelagibacterium limicola]
MLTDRQRLMRSQSRPYLLELHRALSRLRSVITVMHTGAHPDDEQSGMLAVMRLGMGMRTVIACSTRGEGGQNSLGPERAGALGVLRTRELEEAAKVLDADIAWLGHGPDDPVHDFGFSKKGTDTLARWGRERTIERLVRAYRQFRPDIVIPTFLDVPGQHGHHRAMTEAAETALALAADPDAYPEHSAWGLEPWTVAKYYLPSWPGGGGTYDDEVPPPPATVSVVDPGRDPATGARYDEIGEWSRAYHASQGMGHWSAEPRSDWPLHLKQAEGKAELDIRDGLPATLGDLAHDMPEASKRGITQAQVHIDAAIAAFPNRETIIAELAAAAGEIERVQKDTPAQHTHRLKRKLEEIDTALAVAAGLRITGWAEQNALPPAGETRLNIHVELGSHLAPVTIRPVLSDVLAAAHSEQAGNITSFVLKVAADAIPANGFPPDFSSIGGNGLVSVKVETQIGGRAISVPIDLEEAVQIVPRHVVALDPEALIVPMGVSAVEHVVTLRGAGDQNAHLSALNGIEVRRNADRFLIVTPADLPSGRHSLALDIDGERAYRQSDIDYDHIGRARFFRPETLEVLALDFKRPDGARIGYAGGGADRVGLWLSRMGLDVTLLGADELAGGLSHFTTIVIGIFAFGLRPDLIAARDKLRRWVEAGGHLLTLYHRPTDGWDPERTPPGRIVIGSPSLRWRVTDPAAPVNILEPRHPLLCGPNQITLNDFSGWDKERGLYFASEWDPAYSPLLAMNDAGESPLIGSLISAKIGKGRHTHTSLVLHHQLDRLVPGAFRLVANLVQPA